MQAGITTWITQAFVFLLLGLLPAHYASAQSDIPGDGTTTSRLMVPGTFSSDIDPAGDQDVFRVGLISGGIYQIDAAATSGFLDTVIALFPPGQVDFPNCAGADELIFNDNVTPENPDSRIIYTATQTGDHLLCVRGFFFSTGNYQLTGELLPVVITATSPAPLTEANLDGATLTVTLAPGTTYAAPLPAPATNSILLNRAATDLGVMISTVVRNSDTQITLTLAYDGSNPGADFDTDLDITVTVGAAAHTGTGDLSTRTERVTAVVETSALSALTLSTSRLTPDFDAGVFGYTVLVTNSVNGISVTPTAAVGVTITVNGTAVNSDEASAEIALPVGASTIITVAVVAPKALEQVYALTVTRASQPPTFGGTSTGAVTEDDPTTTASGNLTITNLGGGDFFVLLLSIPGRYGSFTIDSGGAWEYILDNANPATNALAAGKMVDETFPVVAGADSSVTTDVVITVTGANDAPTAAINAPATDVIVMTNAQITVIGTGTDPDTGANLSYTWSTVPPNVGSFADPAIATTTWTAPATATSLTLNLLVSDGTADATAADFVTITVTGEPAATISATSPAPLTEADLDGATLTVTLLNTTYEDATLPANQFTLAGVTGLTVSGVVRDSATQATLTLTFDRGTNDFDADATLTVTVLAAAHTGAGDLSTEAETVTATDEASTLSALTLSAGTLTPIFSADTFVYAALVANSVDGITVTPTAEAGAAITVDGTSVNSGEASAEITLTAGTNTITVAVTAPRAPEQTYTLTVTRASQPLTFGTATIADQRYTAGTEVTPLTLPAATAGTPPLTYSIIGGINPAIADFGLSFDSATRVLSGTPTAATSDPSLADIYAYQVTDSAGVTALLAFNLLIQLAVDLTTVLTTSAVANTAPEETDITLTITLSNAVGAATALSGTTFGVYRTNTLSEVDIAFAVQPIPFCTPTMTRVCRVGNSFTLSTEAIPGGASITRTRVAPTPIVTGAAVDFHYFTCIVASSQALPQRGNDCSAAVTLSIRDTLPPLDLTALLTTDVATAPELSDIILTATVRNPVGSNLAAATTTVAFYRTDTATDADSTPASATADCAADTTSLCAIPPVTSDDDITAGGTDEITTTTPAPTVSGAADFHYFACFTNSDDSDTTNNCTPAATVSVTDMPIVFGGADTGTVTEDAATATASGTLTLSNPGGGTDFVARTDVIGTYGTFSIVADTGAWSYALDNANSATNALAEGATVDDVFTVAAAADPTVTEVVTITITGANDAPTAVISAPPANRTVFHGGQLAVVGSNSTDPDAGETASLSYTWSTNPASIGSFADSTAASTTWTAPATGASVILNLLVSDATASATATVTITLVAATANIDGNTAVNHLDGLVMYLSLNPVFRSLRSTERFRNELMGHLRTAAVGTTQELVANAEAWRNAAITNSDVDGVDGVTHLDGLVIYLSLNPVFRSLRGTERFRNELMGHLRTPMVNTTQGLVDNANALAR